MRDTCVHIFGAVYGEPELFIKFQGIGLCAEVQAGCLPCGFHVVDDEPDEVCAIVFATVIGGYANPLDFHGPVFDLESRGAGGLAA